MQVGMRFALLAVVAIAEACQAGHGPPSKLDSTFDARPTLAHSGASRFCPSLVSRTVKLQHGDPSSGDYLFGDTPEEPVPEAFATVGGHRNHAHVQLVPRFEDRLHPIAVNDPHLGFHALGPEVSSELFEILRTGVPSLAQ